MGSATAPKRTKMSSTSAPPTQLGTVSNLREVEHCPGCGAPFIRAPILQCAHCGKIYALRCFLYRSSGKYAAECVDLDLLSLGDTSEEAIGRLQEAMCGYLETAFESGPTKGLVPRLSPLSHRLHYYFHCIRAFIKGLSSERHRSHLVPIAWATKNRLSHC